MLLAEYQDQQVERRRRRRQSDQRRRAPRFGKRRRQDKKMKTSPARGTSRLGRLSYLLASCCALVVIPRGYPARGPPRARRGGASAAISGASSRPARRAINKNNTIRACHDSETTRRHCCRNVAFASRALGNWRRRVGGLGSRESAEPLDVDLIVRFHSIKLLDPLFSEKRAARE